MAEQVLVIDDDQSLSAMVAEYLTPMGFQVTARPTAAAGLRAVTWNPMGVRYSATMSDRL